MAKLAALQPYHILIPTALESNTAKLYQDILNAYKKNATVCKLQRKYFNDSQGMQTVMSLCLAEFASAEMKLQRKHYCLAAAFALIKFVENEQNVYYAANSLRVEYQAPEVRILTLRL